VGDAVAWQPSAPTDSVYCGLDTSFRTAALGRVFLTVTWEEQLMHFTTALPKRDKTIDRSFHKNFQVRYFFLFYRKVIIERQSSFTKTSIDLVSKTSLCPIEAECIAKRMLRLLHLC